MYTCDTKQSWKLLLFNIPKMLHSLCITFAYNRLLKYTWINGRANPKCVILKNNQYLQYILRSAAGGQISHYWIFIWNLNNIDAKSIFHQIKYAVYIKNILFIHNNNRIHKVQWTFSVLNVCIIIYNTHARAYEICNAHDGTNRIFITTF